METKQTHKITIRKVNQHNELDYEKTFARSSKAYAENAAIKYIEENAIYPKYILDLGQYETWFCKDISWNDNWVNSFG